MDYKGFDIIDARYNHEEYTFLFHDPHEKSVFFFFPRSIFKVLHQMSKCVTLLNRYRRATGWNVRCSNPDGVKRFHTGPEAHPASSTMHTEAVSQCLKAPERGVDCSFQCSADVKSENYTTASCLCTFVAGYGETFTFTFRK